MDVLEAMKADPKSPHVSGDAEWWGEPLWGIDNALVGPWLPLSRSTAGGKARIRLGFSSRTSGTGWMSTRIFWSSTSGEAGPAVGLKPDIADWRAPPRPPAPGGAFLATGQVPGEFARWICCCKRWSTATYASSFYALVAVGLVLIFGVLGIINFAHGELYMMGAYCVLYFYMMQDLPYFVALALAAVLLAIFGLIIERLLFRRMLDNPLGGLIISLGLLLVLQATAAMFFGVRMEFITEPLPGSLRLFGESGPTVGIQRLFLIGTAVVLLTGLWAFLHRTRWGWALRACSQDPEAAALQGISLAKVSRMSVCIGAALAAIAGGLSAPLVSPSPYMGHSVIVAAFIVTIVGGLGSVQGALVAAVLYGFIDTFVTTYMGGTVADIVGLVLMLIVLTIKPTGLFGYEQA
ncbi:MAG: branched-chain amino acid ABC transporter permease [Halofilum sp. (in: g-proteobacteria)]|nr:branched-chain amino acid ABC transporter permease [Halofilum sp. (in: g-proteobacteria)]